MHGSSEHLARSHTLGRPGLILSCALLHVTSENPAHGRVRFEVPDALERDFDVLAFALESSIARAAHKQALLKALAQEGLIQLESCIVDDGSNIDDTLIRNTVCAITNYVAKIGGVKTD